VREALGKEEPKTSTVVAALIVAIGASLAGFPFEVLGATAWAGAVFVVWGLGLFVAAGLLALAAGRAGRDLAAVAFAAVALYGFGTTMNSSLLARGLVDASVGIQPGIWAMLTVGLALLAVTDTFRTWVRIVGAAAAAGHAVAATLVLFGAEMPHTGAAPSEWAPLVVAFSKLALWAALVGWTIALRRDSAPQPGAPGSHARAATTARQG
jgi:hypothetical protein